MGVFVFSPNLDALLQGANWMSSNAKLLMLLGCFFNSML